MPAETSRYRDIEIAVANIAGPDGQVRPVAYQRRRFLPQLPSDQSAIEGAGSIAESGTTINADGQMLELHVVEGSDRLDVLAWLKLGDPLLFWRIADVNSCFFPDELTAEIGQTIVIPTNAPGQIPAVNPSQTVGRRTS